MSQRKSPEARSRRRLRIFTVLAVLGVVAVSTALNYLWVRTTSGSEAAPPPAIATGEFSHVHALQVEPDGSLLLGDQDGLWHGRSGGRDWKALGAPLDHLMPVCVARLQDVVLACSTGLSRSLYGAPKGLWRSTDGGRRWKHASLPALDVIMLAANRAVPKTVVAYARPYSVTGIGEGGLWASEDAGRSWRRINRTVADQVPNGIALLAGHPFTVLFATNSGITRSSNGGRTWSFQALGSAQVLALTPSPSRSNIAFAGAGSLSSTGSGIWITKDGGARWRPWVAGPPTAALAAGPGQEIFAFASTTRPYTYLVRGGVFSGRPVVFKGTAPNLGGQIVLAADPTDPSRVYSAFSFPLVIYESRDSGRSWQKIL